MTDIVVTAAQPEPEPAAAPAVEETQVQPQAEEGAQPQADAPASEADTAGEPEGEQPKEQKPRGWVSTRIKELTREKHDERRRADEAIAAKASLEAELRALKGHPGQPAATPAPTTAATPATFDPFDPQSIAAWQAAVVQQAQEAARGTAAEERARLEAEQSSKTFQTRVQEFQGKISEANEGAQRVLTDTSFPLTDDMAEFIMTSPDGVAVADHLGLNPAESARIASLAPLARGVELARLEARLSAPSSKPAPKLTAAPSPVPTVGARAIASANPEKMTQAEYEAWRQSQAPRRA